jgi:hypothetical protein
MTANNDRDLLRLLRSDEGWISAADIEDVIVNDVCWHGCPRVDQCQECFTSLLLRRQLAHLAEKIGCAPDTARAIAKSLADEYLEESR